MYAPVIDSARRVREHRLGPSHFAVLLTDIVGPSPVQNAHLLVIFAAGREDPIAFISAEPRATRAPCSRSSGWMDSTSPTLSTTSRARISSARSPIEGT